MTDFSNLSADITVSEFFTLLQDSLKDAPAPGNASPEKLQIHVTEEGGGNWTMGFQDGQFLVQEEEVEGAPLQVSLSVTDFKAFLVGEIRDALKAKSGGAVLDEKALAQLFVLGNKVELLKNYSGDLALVIENGANAYRLTLTFGGQSPNVSAPTTTTTVVLTDFLEMLDGKIDPQTAFFTGKIRLDGDMNLAMGLATMLIN